MARPRKKDWRKLTRLAKYPAAHPRLIVKYDKQKHDRWLTVHSDSDHAGCRETRKSTSARVIMMGKHSIQAWSATQSVISISSGEAEYYALVRAGSNALGMQAMLKDLGVTVRIRLKTDASVAKSIGNRKGLGKQRHIEVNQLWLQDKVRKGEIEVVTIPREWGF